MTNDFTKIIMLDKITLDLSNFKVDKQNQINNSILSIDTNEPFDAWYAFIKRLQTGLNSIDNIKCVHGSYKAPNIYTEENSSNNCLTLKNLVYLILIRQFYLITLSWCFIPIFNSILSYNSCILLSFTLNFVIFRYTTYHL